MSKAAGQRPIRPRKTSPAATRLVTSGGPSWPCEGYESQTLTALCAAKFAIAGPPGMPAKCVRQGEKQQ